MGLKAGKSYSAKEVKKALESLDFTVSKCEATSKNFIVAVKSKDGVSSTASCKLEGDKCMVQGLVGTHGLTDLGKSAMEGA